MSGVSRSGGMSKVRDVPRISDVSSGQKSRLAAALKVLLIGDSAVGKSSLLLRFSENDFRHDLTSTIGVDFLIRTMDIDGERVKVSIWDTAGQERYRTITEAYYRNAHGILLIYDITSKSSFDNVRGWIRSIEEHSTKGVRVTLVGNKADMDAHRVISKEQGQQLASEFRVPFFETSAKADINVDDIFVCIARESKRLYDETHSLNAEKPTCVNLQGATVPAQVISSCCA
ncbi:hypothetical protein CLOP_g24351 [Closterium sp. NIES-67]|nr:hypothetical protein CLOP_g24351 [Closterium sp. NIES-67]